MRTLTISIEGWEYPLIPRSDFPRGMPRYPNVWFYITKDFIPSYDDAVNYVLSLFDKCDMYRVTWRPPLEDADGEAARDHWQPYDGFPKPTLFHEHSLHLRYYLKALRDKLLEVKDNNSSTYLCWTVATSVHFEPGGSVHYLSMEEYPELQACPFCGKSINKSVAICDIYEKIRDPLGLELLLEGKIRGQKDKGRFQPNKPRRQRHQYDGRWEVPEENRYWGRLFFRRDKHTKVRMCLDSFIIKIQYREDTVKNNMKEYGRNHRGHREDLILPPEAGEVCALKKQGLKLTTDEHRCSQIKKL